MVVCVVGSLALSALIAGLVLWLNADMREQTHLFLGHARARQDHEAYALTTRAFQQRVPEEGFGAYVDQSAPGVRLRSGEWINGHNGSIGAACMEVWLDDASPGTVYVLLVKEGGLWRVNDVTHTEVAACESSD